MRSQQKSRRTSSNQGQASNHRGETRNGGGDGGSHRAPRSGRKHELLVENNWILFNVGGSYFLTSRSTLGRFTAKDSPLNRLSSNSTCVVFDRDDRGAYLIDRDPVYFAVVLNYLRHGHLLLTKDVTEEGVLLEAEFFNIPDLQRLIEQRIRNRSLNFIINQHQQQSQQHPPDGFPSFHQQQPSSSIQLATTSTNNNQLTSNSSAMSSISSSSLASTTNFNSFGLGPIGNGAVGAGGGSGGTIGFSGLLEV